MRRLLLLILLLSCCSVLSSDAQSRLVTQPVPLRNAAADGVTKGVATFTAGDFNAAAGVISLDYTNGQAASGSVKGFLTSADWTTFNAKQATLTAGAGVLLTGATLSTASSETDFLASGALTCGAATQGKAQVHTTPLQYCDNAGTPALQYAAYGNSSGNALTGDSATAFFGAGQLELVRGGTGLSSISALSIWVANSANTLAEVTPGVGQSVRVNGGGTAWEAFTPSSSVPTTITVANEATDATSFVGLFTAATGDLGPKTNANLTFNASTGVLTAANPVAGSITGNAATVTTNANLTGPITSTGNATAIAAQTGTGSTFAMQTSPNFTTSIIVGAGDGTASPLAGISRGPTAVGSNITAPGFSLRAGTGTGTGSAGTLLIAAGVSKEVGGSTAHTEANIVRFGNAQASHPGLLGFASNMLAATITDENTAGSGTAATAVAHSFSAPTLAARNASVTTTDFPNVYIAAPLCGTNMTCTNLWSLWSAGNVRVDGTVSIGGALAATWTGTETLENKRVKKRVTTLSTSTTYTCPGDTSDLCEMQMTGGAGTLTVAAPTGTPVNGDMLMLGFLCTNAQTFAWNATFLASPNVALPVTCPAGVTTWMKVGAQYSTVLTKWQIIATN